MRKAVAIPYVIALILGVAVIALLGIWFVMAGGKFSKQSLDTYCQSKVVAGCSKFINNPNINPDYPAECPAFSFGIDNCKRELGIS